MPVIDRHSARVNPCGPAFVAHVTFCIGIIPGYGIIGIGAPILLLARLMQGLSTGGEYRGAMTFIAEYTPDKRRGFLGSWLEFGTLTGCWYQPLTGSPPAVEAGHDSEPTRTRVTS